MTAHDPTAVPSANATLASLSDGPVWGYHFSEDAGGGPLGRASALQGLAFQF